MCDVGNNLCRACLTTKESFTYYLFEDVSAETYTFCTSVQPNEDDTLPKTLCEDCFDLLTKLSEFKRTCIESQNTLLSYKTIKTEKIQDILQQTDADSIKEDVDIDSQTYLDIKSEDFMKQELFDCQEGLLSPADISEDSTEYKSLKKKKKRNNLTKELNEYAHDEEKQPHGYSCDMCGKKFKHCKRMETHRLGHFNIGAETNLQCLKCNKTFMTSSGLRRHEESVHAVVRLSACACKRCGRVCASKHSLRAHEKMHGVKRAQAVCHVCGKRVSTPVILRAHLETHKADRERRHTCEHCGKKFYTNTILLSHIKRLHTGMRYICGVCSYPFTDKHNLSKHLLIHEGIKLYKCDICNKSYGTNGSLVEHKRIHSGERPFNCSFCSKSFLSKRRLMDHHRTHTGDKPHRCGVCEQRFTQRGTLKRHMKVHDSIKAPLHIGLAM